MNTQPSSSPQPETPPVIGFLPLNLSSPEVPAAVETSPAGGARKLSRWEEYEELWFPEPTDFSHSGINE